MTYSAVHIRLITLYCVFLFFPGVAEHSAERSALVCGNVGKGARLWGAATWVRVPDGVADSVAQKG